MKQLDPKATWLFFLSFIGRMLPIFIPLIIIAISFSASSRRIPYTFESWLSYVPFAVAAVIIFAWVWAKLTYRFYRYELREDGFRKEHGIIWKRYTTIPYDRIQNVDIYRGLIARILGVSDLQIQTAGAIAPGSYGASSEGRLPGLSRETAERLRDELVRRAKKSSKDQGL